MIDFIKFDRRKFSLWYRIQKNQAQWWLKQNAWKIAILCVGIWWAKHQKILIAINTSDWKLIEYSEVTRPNNSLPKVQKASLVESDLSVKALLGETKARANNKPLAAKNMPKNTDTFTAKGGADATVANTYSNVSYWGGRSDSNAKRAAKRAKQEAYIQKYMALAQAEMARFGIPASITLAQGLVESNAGESTLARKNNNHFGLKCFSRTCGKGHCSNHTDDSHKDFFRIFETPSMSFRSHSLMLKSAHYNRLFSYARYDYQRWARGLKALGYATDPHYAESLINTIEDLKLYQYDK